MFLSKKVRAAIDLSGCDKKKVKDYIRVYNALKKCDTHSVLVIFSAYLLTRFGEKAVDAAKFIHEACGRYDEFVKEDEDEGRS